MSDIWKVEFRQGGHFRSISFRNDDPDNPIKNKKEAVAFAERRLNEQYGPQPRWGLAVQNDEAGNPLIGPDNNVVEAEQWIYDVPIIHAGMERPDLHQEHYELVSAELVKRDG